MDLGPTVGADEVPWQWPVDVYPIKTVSVGLSGSWSEIAETYASEVEPLLEPSSVDSLVSEIMAMTDDPAARVRLAAQRVRDDIRYVAVELGENAIIPRSPEVTVQNGYGDCKDKAAVLVAVLRGLGESAWITLIRTGTGPNIEERVPSVFAFDHAIVAYERDGTLHFTDPTAEYTPVDELPFHDQGRRVLIARLESSGLVTTSMSSASDNRWDQTWDVTLREDLYPSVVDRVVATGRFAPEQRDPEPSPDRKEAHVEWGSDVWGMPLTLNEMAFEGDDANQTEWTRELAWESLPMGVADGGSAWLEFDVVGDILWALPDAVTEEEDAEQPLSDRSIPIRLDPFDVRATWVVNTPVGFELQYAPSSETRSFGPLTYTRTVTRDEELTVAVSLVSDAASLSVPDALAAREWALDQVDSREWRATWIEAFQRYQDEGRVHSSGVEARQRYREDPERSIARARFIGILMNNGFGAEARQMAENAVESEPEDSAAWRMLAFSLTKDALGRVNSAIWERDELLRAVERALELEPDHPEMLVIRAIILLHTSEGTVLANGDAQKAVDDVERCEELSGEERGDFLVSQLIKLGEFDLLERRARGRSEPLWRSAVQAAALSRGEPLSPEFERGALSAALLGVLLMAEDADLAVQAARQMVVVEGTDTADLMRSLQWDPDGIDTRRNPGDAMRGMALALSKAEDPSPFLALNTLDSLSETLIPAGILGGSFTGLTVLRIGAGTRMRSDGSDDVGFRLRADADSSRDLLGYVVRERGRYRVLCGPQNAECLSRQALRELEAGREASGLQWLKWLDEEWPSPVENPTPFQTYPVNTLYNQGEPDNPVFVALAGLSTTPTPEVVRRLEEAVEVSEGVHAVALKIALATAYIFTNDQPAAFQLHMELMKEYPNEPALVSSAITMATSAEERTALIEWLTSLESLSPSMKVLLATALSEALDSRAVPMWDELADGALTKREYVNSYAWFRAVLAPDEMVRAAHIVRVLAGSGESQAVLHTVATIEVALGEYDNGLKAYVKAVGLLGSGGELVPDWIPVRAQLLAAWGLHDQADSMLASYESDAMSPVQMLWHERAKARLLELRP